MNTFRYETHCHTAETSRCGKSPAKDTVKFYKALGYAGIIITDHFFNGNTLVPKDIPWVDRAEQFAAGYYAAKKAGDEIGLDVMFGWEYGYHGADLLTYGLSPEWLVEHPEVMEWSVEDYIRNVQALGGMVIHAHPFREASYIHIVHLFPELVDGVEVCNIGNDPKFDERAEWFVKSYSDQYKMVCTAGSDLHRAGMPRLAGVEFDHRLTDINDYIRSVKTEEHHCFKLDVPMGLWDEFYIEKYKTQV